MLLCVLCLRGDAGVLSGKFVASSPNISWSGDGGYFALLDAVIWSQVAVESLTVGFLLPGESLATDRGEKPGSTLSTSLAVLKPEARVGVFGVYGKVGLISG